MKWWAVLAAGKRTDRPRKKQSEWVFPLLSCYCSKTHKITLHKQRIHRHTIDFLPLSTAMEQIWMMCLMRSKLRRIIDVSANTTWLPVSGFIWWRYWKNLHGNWVMKFSNNHTPKPDEWLFIWNKQSFWPANWSTISCDWSNRCSFICTPPWQNKTH